MSTRWTKVVHSVYYGGSLSGLYKLKPLIILGFILFYIYFFENVDNVDIVEKLFFRNKKAASKSGTLFLLMH